MGASGSGRRWSSRDPTNEYLRMDVRFMEREGFLRAHRSGSLYWSRRGERTASISFRTEDDRLVLSYKESPNAVGSGRTSNTRSFWSVPAATTAGSGVGSCVRLVGVADVSQRCLEGAFTLTGAAMVWHTSVSVKS